MSNRQEREVREWIGKTPDTPIPVRVKLRILERQECRCAHCGRKFDAKLKPEYHHEPALIEGGENRESKIIALCDPCHAPLTAETQSNKAKVYDLRSKFLGLKKSKHPMPCGRQSPFRKKMSGEVVRR